MFHTMRFQLRVLEEKRDTLIASNKSIAESNLVLEPAYRTARQDLAQAHKAAQDEKREVESLRDKLNELSRQTSLDTTLALMQTATAEAEEESEKIAAQFLDKELPVESFISQFIAVRKTAHLRRVKTDKLSDYIRNQNSQPFASGGMSGAGPVRPAPPPPVLPYPMAGTGMPQPGASFPFSRPAYPPYQ